MEALSEAGVPFVYPSVCLFHAYRAKNGIFRATYISGQNVIEAEKNYVVDISKVKRDRAVIVLNVNRKS